MTQHNQESAQWSPDPFSHERVGSGDETTHFREMWFIDCSCKKRCYTLQLLTSEEEVTYLALFPGAK